MGEHWQKRGRQNFKIKIVIDGDKYYNGDKHLIKNNWDSQKNLCKLIFKMRCI